MAKRSCCLQGALRSVRLERSSVSSLFVESLEDTCCSVFLHVIFDTCSSKWAISSRSARLKVPILLNISSQSTWSPSNSGPSIQTNFVLPPIVRRQAPHMPVPSTIIVLRETSFGILYFFANNEQNFIIIGGPMARTLSTCSRFITSSIPTVITPFCPQLPSSVMTITSSLYFLTSSTMMTSSLVRPASIEMMRLPACLSAVRMGKMAAIPMPPPAQITVP